MKDMKDMKIVKANRVNLRKEDWLRMGSANGWVESRSFSDEFDNKVAANDMLSQDRYVLYPLSAESNPAGSYFIDSGPTIEAVRASADVYGGGVIYLYKAKGDGTYAKGVLKEVVRKDEAKA